MKIGGLFFGYGGLDLAVQSVIPDAHLAWYSEFDKGANKIAAHRFPGVPNHGDITKIDWSTVEPVDILTGGSPCQDLSHAGRRAGMTDGTRSNLWVAMAGLHVGGPLIPPLDRLALAHVVHGGRREKQHLGLDVAVDGNGNGHGKSLAIEAQRLLPTPVTEPDTGNGHARNLGKEARLLPTPRVTQAGYADDGRGGKSLDVEARRAASWGDYAAAIARWEHALGRPAPAPTMTSTKGNPQLSPVFVEWLMGLSAGWVTDVPGITRNEALKALGNGVVPQQAAAALRLMLNQEVAA